MKPNLDRRIAGLRCRDLLELLPDYVGAELAEDRSERVAGHLGECDHCRKFGGEYGRLVSELGRRAAELDRHPIVDPDVRERLLARLEQEWGDDG